VPAAAFDAPQGSKGAPPAQQKGKAAPAPAQGQPQQGQQPQQGGDAANAEDPPKDKNKAAETAARMLDAGIKAYEAGKIKDAVRLFDTLLQGGSITHPQMAQALYYRGLARRKDNKPGLAISDLTAAIWLKDGLGPSEKQEAMRQRVAAYQEAGIGDVPDFGPPPDSGSTYAGAIPSAAPAPPGSSGGAPWQTAMGATAPPPAAYAAAPPPQAARPTSSGSSGGIGGFFSSVTNFFTGGPGSTGSPPPAPAAAAPPAAPAAYPGDVTTASISQPKPGPSVSDSWSQAASPGAPPPAQSAGAESLPWQHATAAPQPAQPPAGSQGEALPWSTSGPASTAAPAGYAAPPAPVAAASPVAATPVAATPAAAKAAAPAASYVPLKGKYKIQVGAVRTREEADLMVAKLLTEHGGELGGRDPKIDQAPIGNMGTFYRVRVGPYASASEPKTLCGALKTSGFDCLVVTN
jgi:cell division protein FtsN